MRIEVGERGQVDRRLRVPGRARERAIEDHVGSRNWKVNGPGWIGPTIDPAVLQYILAQGTVCQIGIEMIGAAGGAMAHVHLMAAHDVDGLGFLEMTVGYVVATAVVKIDAKIAVIKFTAINVPHEIIAHRPGLDDAHRAIIKAAIIYHRFAGEASSRGRGKPADNGRSRRNGSRDDFPARVLVGIRRLGREVSKGLVFMLDDGFIRVLRRMFIGAGCQVVALPDEADISHMMRSTG